MAERSGIWVPPGGSADPRREDASGSEPQSPPPSHESQEPTPEQLQEAIRRVKTSDVLLSTLASLAQLAWVKLAPETRDLEQARIAIEGMRALIPVLEGAAGEQELRDLRQVVTNLQLAYADAVSGGEAPPPSAAA